MPINFSSPTIINSVSIIKGLPLFDGEIYRVLNSGSITETYTFTNIYGETNSVTLSAGQKIYNLEKSQSFSSGSSEYYDTSLKIAKISLLTTITDSNLGNTFTEILLTTTGASNWTKPAGVTEVIVECWGAGGAGGGVTTGPAAAGGGAGGAYARKKIIYTSPSISIPYTIGAGGTGVTGAAGNNGEDTTWDTNIVVAKGGGGGPLAIANSQNPGGIQQTGNIGDIIHDGNIGVQGENYIVPESANAGTGGNGPGSCGFSLIEPGFSIFKTIVEYGGNVQYVNTNSVTAGSADGPAGYLYGSGGTGAAKLTGPNRAGGAGAQGLIRLIYR